MTIAVTGATGALGSLVIEALLQRVDAQELIALARDTSKAAPLAAEGVAVREFDYSRPDTLAPGLDGVDRLLLISGNEVGARVAQHTAVVDAARDAGVGFLAYTSVLGADDTINPLGPEHIATEARIRASGLAFSLLRNGWYNENYLPALQQAAAAGELLTSAGEGRVASASRADFAEAAASVLALEDPEPVYELGGDLAWTQEELAQAFSTVLGRAIPVHQVTTEEHTRVLLEAGLDEGAAGFVTGIDAAIARGDLAGGTGTISALIGRPTTPLIDTLRTGR